MTNEINAKLGYIQAKLKAPKGQYNSFGNYKYRNCEDILEALKPLLDSSGTTLTISDELVMVGDPSQQIVIKENTKYGDKEIVKSGARFYIKATATLLYNDEKISACGYAREEDTKKGMDLSQLTGSTSSYARKYALNGLFLIDDTKDSDTTNNHGKETQRDKLRTVAKDLNKEASEQIRQKVFLKLKSDLESCETVQDLELCTTNPKFKQDSTKLDNARAELLRGTYKGMKENLTKEAK